VQKIEILLPAVTPSKLTSTGTREELLILGSHLLSEFNEILLRNDKRGLAVSSKLIIENTSERNALVKKFKAVGMLGFEW